jgi:predicted nucleic acid-binding protein
MTVAGHLVPDAHVATILCEHGVLRTYTADTDFWKFDFLEVINPLRRKSSTN